MLYVLLFVLDLIANVIILCFIIYNLSLNHAINTYFVMGLKFIDDLI